jgi:hypothetical protein
MGKRGRAEDKGKGEDNELIGIIKGCHIDIIHLFFVCPPEGGLVYFSVFRFKNSKMPILIKQQRAS